MQALTAGIVNLVPEGLILLISLTAAVSAFKMAQRGVLAQQLNAIESLASVDVVCTDKTGTLTEPTLRVVELVPAGGVDEETLARALAGYAASAPSRNPTLRGDRRRRAGDGRGAPRARAGAVLLAAALERARARRRAARARRAGAVRAPIRRSRSGRAPRRAPDGACWRSATEAPLPAAGLGAALPRRRARARARRARRAAAAERGRDGRLLRRRGRRAEGAVGRRAGDGGRDRPRRRRAGIGAGARRRGAAVRAGGAARGGAGRARRRAASRPRASGAVVEALADGGRYVAMVGDGVNDVPALKEARLAIAQGSGTQMARSVADLVLVRDDFGVVPGMVAEGRQILRNIQRVAQLFVTKTVFTAVVGAGGRDPDRDLPAAPAPVHDRLHGHDRHPRLRARAGAELGAVAAGGLPPVGRALRDPGRAGDRDRDRRRLPARPLRLRPRPRAARARSPPGSWSPAGSPS